MKRYELKDKEKQAALEKVFPGFGKDLQAACDAQFDDVYNHVCVEFSNDVDVLYDNAVEIKKAAICTKEAYNPRAWNNYPEATPPECVLMRIEGRDDDDDAFHFSGYFKNRMWVDEYGYALATNTYTVERFRPWDEKEK